MTADGGSRKRYSPAAERNWQPILAVLNTVLPTSGLLLEIASGSGQHATLLAPHFPGMTWQPSDIDPDALASIDAWTTQSGAPNVLPAVMLDVTATAWPVTEAQVILCANMIHISPWEAAEGLFSGAARLLSKGGCLVVYGPFWQEGVEPAPSNREFDASLRRRDQRWGVRALKDVEALAQGHGFAANPSITVMPANNLAVVFVMI